MKSTIYKIAALTFAVASMSACSLDEYNPSQKTGDEILATFDGLKGLQSYCYSSLYFLKYNHNCISVYYIMLGTNMAIL